MPAYLKKLHDRENGFTLIELLIVVLIIGVLAAIAIPVYLGIQSQGVKAAVRADVNLAVKNVQVGLTEGTALDAIDANQSPTYMKASQTGETVTLARVDGGSQFTVTGIVSTNSTPKAGRTNFTYAYDSRTGKFTESDSGSGQPATLQINTASLPDGNTTDPYSATVNVSGTNTTGTNTFSITGLPNGLTYDATTGKITGTASTNGSFTVNVTVTNGSATASQVYTLRVYAKPVITTTSLPAGTVGTDYTPSIVASSDPAATFAVTTGALPDGVTLGANGTFSGKPTTASSYPFTVTATNSAGSTTQSYTVVVNSVPAFTTTTLPTAVLNKTYTGASISASGSPAPTYTVVSGSLPPGITLDANTGALGGAATNAATYAFTVKATNSAGSKTQDFSITVNGQLATPSVSLTRFIGRNSVVTWNAVPNASSYQVTYSGAYSGTYTTTGTSYQQALPIGTNISSVTASVKALNTNYADSNTGSTAISVPGSRMNGGGGFSTCVYDSNGLPINASNCAIVSTDGAWTTVSQGDGNFVEYKTDINNISTYRAYYATQTNGSGYHTSMQADNNLVVYGPSSAIKATNTYSTGNNGYLVMQTDGNLALYTSGGAYVWGTTGGTSYNANFMYYVGP